MKRLWKNKACKMKVKQLSRELDISWTSNKVSYFPFGPGPLHDICGQAEWPSHSPLLLFSWHEPERHTWGKCIHVRKKRQNMIFVSLSRKKKNKTMQTKAKAGQNILHEFPFSLRVGLRNYNIGAPRINYFSSSV